MGEGCKRLNPGVGRIQCQRMLDIVLMTAQGKVDQNRPNTFPLARADESEEDPMTRIASIATYRSPPRPVVTWTAQEEMKAWSVVLTELKTDDGLIGYGLIHGSPMPRVCEWVARFADIVSGMDALAHEAVWNRLFALTCPRPGAIDSSSNVSPPLPRGERTQIMAAIAGIDIALWDLKGKAAGLPVYRLLGGENKPLTTYATGGYYRAGASDADYGEELARFVALGYRGVKLKTGAGTPADETKRSARCARRSAGMSI